LTGAAPVISVVIPCFNGERFVPDAVRSVLAQTLGAPEVIVVDDRSSDRSVEVVEPLTAGGMVRLVRHDENRGIAAARNTGIRAARGRFIGLLDQDDLWREDKLARQIEVFERDAAGRIGAVFSHVDVLDLATGVRRRQLVRLPRNIERPSRTSTGLNVWRLSQTNMRPASRCGTDAIPAVSRAATLSSSRAAARTAAPRPPRERPRQ